MTFKEYIARPSGVGRTKWFIFLFIRAMAPIMLVGGFWIVFADKDPWGWAAVGVGASIYIGFYVGTRKNYMDDKALEEKGPNNPLNHHVELWDGADYVCMHGIKPSKRTHKCAWPIAHDLNKFPDEPSVDERAIQYEM